MGRLSSRVNGVNGQVRPHVDAEAVAVPTAPAPSTTAVSYGSSWPLPVVLERFHETAPGVEIRTQEIDTHEAAAGLVDRSLDWAIVRQTAPVRGTTATPLFPGRFVAALVGKVCECLLILLRTTCGSGWPRCCHPTRSRAAPSFPGRRRVPDRTALVGVLHALRTGVAWRDVPAESVGCSVVTAWRRLRDRTEAGVWPRPQAALSPNCVAPTC